LKKLVIVNLCGVVLTASGAAFEVWSAFKLEGHTVLQVNAVGGAATCAVCMIVWIVLLLRAVRQ
jgi:hypothetical protein